MPNGGVGRWGDREVQVGGCRVVMETWRAVWEVKGPGNLCAWPSMAHGHERWWCLGVAGGVLGGGRRAGWGEDWGSCDGIVSGM